VKLCVEGCGRIAEKGDLCYADYLKTVNVNYGHLRNRLYPGLTNRETEQAIRAEAQAKGEDAVPADWA
jgi:hypothetical protein